MNLKRLTAPSGPWLHLLVATASETDDLRRAVEQAGPGRVAARLIRGRKSATAHALFDEAAAALQFPYYFGENWDAFFDCVTDLEWLRADAVVLLFADAQQLLAKAAAKDVERFVTVLNETSRHWSEAGRAFHVLLQTTADEEAATHKRWQAAGLALHRLG
jgi:hypothetical protein